mmetsp:Transcript_27105/g.85257  ORF Transcript_27105/g.85257 Transcript_27105/m.85257 type:complete len:592 (-) Transcript_27105:351-2126(-)
MRTRSGRAIGRGPGPATLLKARKRPRSAAPPVAKLPKLQFVGALLPVAKRRRTGCEAALALPRGGGGATRLEQFLGSNGLASVLGWLLEGDELRALACSSRTAQRAVAWVLRLQWRMLDLGRRVHLGPAMRPSALTFGRQTSRSMDFLRRAATLLEMQAKAASLPDPNYIARRQDQVDVAAMPEARQRLLSPVLRQVLVDWMAEVCTMELSQPTQVLHAAVRLLDQALGKVAVTARDLLLAGCVAILIESHAAAETAESNGTKAPPRLGVQDIVFVTANQFNGFEVCKSYNIIVSNCKASGEAPSRAYPTALDWVTFMDDYIRGARPTALPASVAATTTGSGGAAAAAASTDIVAADERPLTPTREPVPRPRADPPSCSLMSAAGNKGMPPRVPEEKALARFLLNLSLLDYGMLRFLPSTVAAAVLILARCTCLAGDKKPKAAVWSNAVADLLRSCDAEKESVTKAVWRLWKLQRDYLDYFTEKDLLMNWASAEESAFTEWWSRSPRCTRYCREDLEAGAAQGALVYAMGTGKEPLELPRVLEPHPQLRGHLRGIERVFQAEGVDLHNREWTTTGPARPCFIEATLQRILG